MMIRKNEKINREYLYYLMNDVGLFNDSELDEIGISYDEYDDPNEEVIDKIENYIDKKNRD